MTDPTHDAKLPTDSGEVDAADAVRADIADARAELAATVDALSEKLDVKARAREKVSLARQRSNALGRRVKGATPEPVQRAMAGLGGKAAPVMHQVSEKTAPHRAKIAAGAAVLVVALVVIARRRGADERS
jgi:Protein of unknown function (DUF3618)